MESILRHIGNFVSTGDGTAAVYLHALDEHLNVSTSERDVMHLAETVNFLLSKAKTRILGLQVLDKIWPWLNQEILEQKTELWTTFILKSCNQEELQKYGGLIYRTLANVARTLKQYSELSKSFGSNHLNKIIEIITHTPTVYCVPALKCAEIYLSIYTKLNGQSRAAIERFLTGFLDTFDETLNHYVGRCLQYLQCTSIPGSKDMKIKEQWKSYQLLLIESMSKMLDEAYGEDSEGSAIENGASFNLPPLNLSNEPNKRAAQLFVRFHNLSKYLSIALCEPSSVAKAIMPKRILNFISNGLVVTCAATSQAATYSKIAFGVFLPKIQLDLLELKKALIRTLHCNLRIYYKTVLSTLVHVLNTSITTNKTVRAEAYNVISLWCETLNEGSRCELYADEIIPEILKDISPIKHELVSQIKMKEKLKNKKGYNPSNIKERTSYNFVSNNQAFYMSSIKCLQILIKSCSCFFKPTTMACIQTTVIKICSSFLVTKKNDPYKNWKNRIEMYRLLHILLTSSQQHCPPPSQIIIDILRTAQSTECNTEIRRQCKEMIVEIETILHPQKESLIIPIEARSIRNAFLKHGQERLLEELHDSISTLRYEMEDKSHENVDPRKSFNGETCMAQAENERQEVENVKDVEDEDSSSSFRKRQVSVEIHNIEQRQQSKELDDGSTFGGPEAKKQKGDENFESSESESINISEDSNKDDENLRPCSPVPRPVLETHRINKVNLEKQEQTSTPGQNAQITQVKSASSTNAENEIAEMEAFFVDELKKTA